MHFDYYFFQLPKTSQVPHRLQQVLHVEAVVKRILRVVVVLQQTQQHFSYCGVSYLAFLCVIALQVSYLLQLLNSALSFKHDYGIFLVKRHLDL